MRVRAIRGATQLEQDTAQEMEHCVGDLLTQMLEANNLSKADLISVILTATQDLKSDFPAAEVTKLVAKFGGEVPELTVIRPSLEDIYLKMIGQP